MNALDKVYANSLVIDFGAIDQIILTSELFFTYILYLSNKKIIVANNPLTIIARFGDIYLIPTFILKNVLFVPKI